MLRKKNLFMVLLLVFALLTNGISMPVYAAELQKQGTVTVLGADEDNPLVSETTVQFGDADKAIDVLKRTVGEENINFTDSSFGKMLTGINGLEAEGTNYWAFFVNGVFSFNGPNDYTVQNGDKLTFRYTDYTKPPEKTAALKVTGYDGNNLADYSGIEYMGTPSAFHLLQAVLGPEQVGITETQWGRMIVSINGVEADDQHYWGFYVNGEMAQEGAETYALVPDDEISFQLDSIGPLPGDGDNGQTNPEPPAGGTVSKETLKKAIDSVSEKILASEIGEWEAIALTQAGKAIPAGYLDSVKQIVNEKNGKFRNITDTERYVLGIVAAGGDPVNIEGYDLVGEIYNGTNMTRQGLNGVAFALIALDSADFTVPDDALWTREKLINYLLEKQNADGGWNWDGVSASDVDSTAMILTALAPYKDQAGIKETIDPAVQYFAAEYQASKINNSNTAAQMIIALSALGIDANASQFAKDDSSLFQYLLSFQTSDGGFAWQPGETDSNGYATQQSLLSLVAYQLFAEGKGSLYQLALAEQKPEPNQPGKETPGTEIPKTETPKTDTPNVEKPTVQTSAAKGATDKKAGNKLPNTATDMYNLLAVGLLLLSIGIGIFIRQRKTKA